MFSTRLSGRALTSGQEKGSAYRKGGICLKRQFEISATSGYGKVSTSSKAFGRLLSNACFLIAAYAAYERLLHLRRFVFTRARVSALIYSQEYKHLHWQSVTKDREKLPYTSSRPFPALIKCIFCTFNLRHYLALLRPT